MKIGVQSGGIIEFIGAQKTYAAIRQAGFEVIDWQLDHALTGDVIRTLSYQGKCIFEKPLEEVIAYYTPELEIIRENGLTISQAHAPFPAYLTGHPELLDYMIGIYERMIELCDYAGCPRVVIHGISLSQAEKKDDQAMVDKLNWKLYSALIPVLQRTNVVVCLENLCSWTGGIATEGVCHDPHDAARMIDKLNAAAGKNAFGLCLDIGHLQLVAKDIRKFAPILGQRIVCLHIHDNNARTDQHLAPFAGTTNWKNVCAALKESGYAGDLCFETFRQAQNPLLFDEKLLLPWLELICQTGEAFRKRIQN